MVAARELLRLRHLRNKSASNEGAYIKTTFVVDRSLSKVPVIKVRVLRTFISNVENYNHTVERAHCNVHLTKIVVWKNFPGFYYRTISKGFISENEC